MKSKRIVHVVEATATGTLSMVSLLANLQSQEGKKVAVIYSLREETPKDFISLFSPNIDMTKINMKGSLNILLSVFRLRNNIKNKDCVVFLHSSFAGFIDE